MRRSKVREAKPLSSYSQVFPWNVQCPIWSEYSDQDRHYFSFDFESLLRVISSELARVTLTILADGVKASDDLPNRRFRRLGKRKKNSIRYECHLPCREPYAFRFEPSVNQYNFHKDGRKKVWRLGTFTRLFDVESSSSIRSTSQFISRHL